MRFRLDDKKNRAQSTLEYAAFIVCLVVALISMGVYFKRAVNGNLRSSLDGISPPFDPGSNYYNLTTAETGTEQSYVTVLPTPLDLNGNGEKDDWVVNNIYGISTETPVRTVKNGNEGF